MFIANNPAELEKVREKLQEKRVEMALTINTNKRKIMVRTKEINHRHNGDIRSTDIVRAQNS